MCTLFPFWCQLCWLFKSFVLPGWICVKNLCLRNWSCELKRCYPPKASVCFLYFSFWWLLSHHVTKLSISHNIYDMSLDRHGRKLQFYQCMEENNCEVVIVISSLTFFFPIKERSPSCIARAGSNLHYGWLHSDLSLEVSPTTCCRMTDTEGIKVDKRTCLMSSSPCWYDSPEEAGRYLETYKSYEKKPADILKEQVEKDYVSKVGGFLQCEMYV